MACWTLKELKDHLGHDVNLTDFAGEVCIVCDDCNEVLLEFHEEPQHDGADYMGDCLTLGPEPQPY